MIYLFVALLGMFLCSNTYAQDSVRYGFKGFELGMTKAEVSQMLKATEWESGYDYPFTDTVLGDVILPKDEKANRPKQEPRLNGVGCAEVRGEVWCPEFWAVQVRFANDRVRNITLLSDYYPQPEADALSTLILTAITNKYGPPRKQYSIAALRQAKTDTAEWSHNQQVITVEVRRSRKSADYIFSITITDTANGRENVNKSEF